MDGVLVNSEAHICYAGFKMFREKGFRVDEEDFTEFTGMGENRYLGGVAEKHHIPLDGVSEFLAKCRERKFLIVLASSADPIKIKTIAGHFSNCSQAIGCQTKRVSGSRRCSKWCIGWHRCRSQSTGTYNEFTGT